MRVLVVEDNPIIGEGLIQGLSHRGFTVDLAINAESAKTALSLQNYLALVLDLGLPDQDGNQIINELRRKQNALPILILTARDAIKDRIESLDAGADDYMVKPFDLDELSARLRALIRRSQGRSAPILQHGDLTLNPATRQISKGGKLVDLAPKEFSLIELLLEKKGKVLTKEFLEEQLYSWDKEIESNAVEVHIHYLRKKLGSNLIKNIRGVGYTIPNQDD